MVEISIDTQGTRAVIIIITIKTKSIANHSSVNDDNYVNYIKMLISMNIKLIFLGNLRHRNNSNRQLLFHARTHLLYHLECLVNMRTPFGSPTL